MGEYLFRTVTETGEWEIAEAPPHSGMEGFRTDGASIPRLLWPVLGHPFEARLADAAAGHDFDYRMGEPRRSADARFHRELLGAGVGATRARLLWLGVRAFGWLYWRRCRFGRGING